MLYIVTHNGMTLREWHVGEKANLLDSEIKNVNIVEADTDELRYIINNMPNVPYNKTKASARWYGDIAKFISANL